MKITLILMIFSWMLVACQQESRPINSVNEIDSLLVTFSAFWIADSLGQNGFRANHYSFDSTNRTWLINELSFKGHTEQQIIKWLGQPSSSGRHKEDNGLIMEYSVRRNSKDPDIDLLIYFDGNDKVNDIVKSIGMPK